MKKSKNITSIAFLATVLFFCGCKKDDTASGSSVPTTLKGQVKAELNVNQTGNENVPDGTKITFLINPNDLLNKPDTTKKLDSYRYSATVVGGQYTITLPARNDGSKVKIVADDFEYMWVYDSQGNSMRVVYSAPEGSITLYAGSTQYYDVNY